MKDILLPIAEFIINIVLCVVIVGLTQRIVSFDIAQEILLGSILFIALVVTQVSYRFSRQNRYFGIIEDSNLLIRNIDLGVKDIAKIEHNIISLDERTKLISDGLRKIAADNNDLFIFWYHEKLNDLLKHINSTIEARSFYMDAKFSIQEQDRMNDLFRGCENDFFWAISSCDGISWFSTARGNIYICGMYRKYKEKKVIEIRRLFVYENESELSRFMTQLCFLLHEQSGYEYRILSRHDFDAIFHGFGDKNLARDFGIFGNHFVWETSAENTINIETGYVCVDENKVVRYKQLYQMMWSHAISYKITDEQLVMTYKGCDIAEFRNLYMSATSGAKH